MNIRLGIKRLSPRTTTNGFVFLEHPLTSETLIFFPQYKVTVNFQGLFLDMFYLFIQSTFIEYSFCAMHFKALLSKGKTKRLDYFIKKDVKTNY